MNLLEDIVVIDFSQFLSGPSAGLRLADMGARVIKIEKTGTGDICRELYVSDVLIGGESTIFIDTGGCGEGAGGWGVGATGSVRRCVIAAKRRRAWASNARRPSDVRT